MKEDHKISEDGEKRTESCNFLCLKPLFSPLNRVEKNTMIFFPFTTFFSQFVRNIYFFEFVHLLVMVMLVVEVVFEL